VSRLAERPPGFSASQRGEQPAKSRTSTRRKASAPDRYMALQTEKSVSKAWPLSSRFGAQVTNQALGRRTEGRPSSAAKDLDWKVAASRRGSLLTAPAAVKTISASRKHACPLTMVATNARRVKKSPHIDPQQSAAESTRERNQDTWGSSNRQQFNTRERKNSNVPLKALAKTRASNSLSAAVQSFTNSTTLARSNASATGASNKRHEPAQSPMSRTKIRNARAA